MPKHRTRSRPRAKPRPQPDETELDLAELAVLWPCLDAALARDTAGPSAEPTGSTGAVGAGSAAVLNLDVQHAQVEIAGGVARIEAEAQRLLNLTPARRTTLAVIEAMPDWYRQLRDRGQPLANHIRDDVPRWLRHARSVLRLRTREQPLGRMCPHHRDHPAELLREADEAVLSDAVRAGRQPPPGTAPLTWRRAESVRCPRCKLRWSGITELRVLMRMIEQADAGQDLDTTEPDCSCRCHVGTSQHTTCDVDAGYGVGCGPHGEPNDP